MTNFTRRAALHGVAVGGVAALAGCAETGNLVLGEDGSAGDGDDPGTDGGSEGGGPGADGVATTVRQVGEPLSGPGWDRTERRGICTLLVDGDEAPPWLLDETPEPVSEFVAETDFAESAVCYVESVGPTTCHDEIAFDGVDVTDGTLVADATVKWREGEAVACGEAFSYPSALLRVTSDPLPESARLSVTDGSGETGAVRDGDGTSDR